MNDDPTATPPPPLRIGLPSRLGEMLVRDGVVSPEDVEGALGEQSSGSEFRLGRLLVGQGVLDDRTLVDAIARQFHTGIVDLRANPPQRRALAQIPVEAALRLHALPVRVDDGLLEVAVADPPTRELRVAVERVAGVPVRLVLCPDDELTAAIEYWYCDLGSTGAHDDLLASQSATPTSELQADELTVEAAANRRPEAHAEVDPGPEAYPEPGREPEPVAATDSIGNTGSGAPAPATKESPGSGVVAWILRDADRQRASAVHLDHDADGLRVRYRVGTRLLRGPTLSPARARVVWRRVLDAAGLDPAVAGIDSTTVEVVEAGVLRRCRVAVAASGEGGHLVVARELEPSAPREYGVQIRDTDLVTLRRVLNSRCGLVAVGSSSPAIRRELCALTVAEAGVDRRIVVGVPRPGGEALPPGVIWSPLVTGAPSDGVGLAELLDADVLVVDDVGSPPAGVTFDAAAERLVIVVVDGDDPTLVVASLVRSVGAWPVAGYLRAVVVGRDDADPTAEVNVVTGEVCRAILDIQPHS